MANILVTGGAGFIGSHLVDQLIEEGHNVVIIDNLSTGKIENVNSKATLLFQDLCDEEKTRHAVINLKPDYVFHLAALARIQPSIKDPIKWNDNNTDATLNLLWACHKAGTVKKFVYSSSSSVYGDTDLLPIKEDQELNPKSPYSLYKYFGERNCQLFNSLYGLPTVALRYFNVYGPRQVLEGDYATVIGIFLKQQKNGEKLTIVGDGEQRRDFTYVNDIVEANVSCMDHDGDFNVYNAGTGINYSINEVSSLVEPDTSKHKKGLVRKAEARETQADIIKIRKELGWKAKYSLKDGIYAIRNKLR